MTAARYEVLKRLCDRAADAENFYRLLLPREAEEFRALQRWEKRSAAAQKAVETKRKKYPKWPTRKGDHLPPRGHE